MELTHIFRTCKCPGTPHGEGDSVTFPAKLPFAVATRAIGAIYSAEPATPQNAFAVYLHAPVSWNLIDEEGHPVPLTDEALDELDFASQYEIADHGDTLYRDGLISPLVQRKNELSRNGPTGGSSARRSKS